MFDRLICQAAPVALLATCWPLEAADFNGNLGVTSDYVFRGISQSNRHVAVQAGARVDTEAGLYASAWGSSVDFASVPEASAEMDGTVGMRRALGVDWVADLNATWFTYAGASQLNYVEWIATATWRDRHGMSLGVSGDVFASGRTGVYGQAGVRIPVHDTLRVELAGGFYWLDRAYGRDYAHGQVTLAWLPHANTELRLSGHFTDHDAKRLFGELAGPRLEAAVQASF